VDQTDSFIEEVTEEVRRDRLFAAFRKYGWIGAVAIVAIVGGSAFTEWRSIRARDAAQAFGDSLLAAVQADDPGAALSEIQADGPRVGVAKLMSAAQAVQDGRADAALADLNAVAADATLPASLRDLARLKAVLIAGDTMTAEARRTELEALAQPGAPYRLMALEQLAVLALETGDTAAAIAKAREVLSDSAVTPGLQQRATELIVALGGDPAAETATQ